MTITEYKEEVERSCKKTLSEYMDVDVSIDQDTDILTIDVREGERPVFHFKREQISTSITNDPVSPAVIAAIAMYEMRNYILKRYFNCGGIEQYEHDRY